MRRIYLDHGAAHPGWPYRTGEAGLVFARNRAIETDTRVSLSANSTHALLEHGVVAQLNALRLEIGAIGEGRDAMIPQAELAAASRIFYEADRRTYGGRYEFVIGEAREPEPRQYCVRIDNREYQRSLSRLQYLVTHASRLGHAVRLRIESRTAGDGAAPVEPDRVPAGARGSGRPGVARRPVRKPCATAGLH